jgi:integrase
MAGKRGMGCVYKRGNLYWIKYSVNGRLHLESSRSSKEADAKRLLKRRLGESAEGRFTGPKFERILLSELCEDVLTDYRINGKRSLDKAQRSVRHLLGFFKEVKAQEVSTDRVNSFIAHRQAQGVSNAEINRELAALKRAFNLGLRAEKIVRKPYIPMLKENNVRQGFFESEDFRAVREALPDHLKPVLTFAYLTGWRKEEILGLRWAQVDRGAGTIRIGQGVTKGGEGRTIILKGELKDVIDGQWDRRRLDCPYVFHRAGKRIKDFRGAWGKALNVAAAEGKIFHDFRRTGIRNMLRDGVRERVAMLIAGHKTRNILDRYDIVNEEDLQNAAERMAKGHQQRMVTTTVTMTSDTALQEP